MTSMYPRVIIKHGREITDSLENLKKVDNICDCPQVSPSRHGTSYKKAEGNMVKSFYMDIISRLVISDMSKFYKLIANKEMKALFICIGSICILPKEAYLFNTCF